MFADIVLIETCTMSLIMFSQVSNVKNTSSRSSICWQIDRQILYETRHESGISRPLHHHAFVQVRDQET